MGSERLGNQRNMYELRLHDPVPFRCAKPCFFKQAGKLTQNFRHEGPERRIETRFRHLLSANHGDCPIALVDDDLSFNGALLALH
jgi:hypothetical protein